MKMISTSGNDLILGSTNVSENANTALQSNSTITLAASTTTLTLNSTFITSNFATFRFNSTVFGPVTVQQATDATASATGDAFNINAQDVSGNTLTTGGAMTLRAGNATGSGGTHSGGTLNLYAGDATGGSGTRNGGNVYLSSGSGASFTGEWYLQRGGTTLMQSASGGVRVTASAGTACSTGHLRMDSGSTMYIRGSSLDVRVLSLSGNDVLLGYTSSSNNANTRIYAVNGGVIELAVLSTSVTVSQSNVTVEPKSLIFSSSTTDPEIYQGDDTAASATGDLFLISAQSVTGNTTTTGGTLQLLGGNATGAGGTHTGGDIYLWAGSANGASGTRNGGDAYVKAGGGATADGSVYIQDATANNRISVNSTGIGFHNTSPIAKPTITGSRSSNAALASLLTALANYGLLTDSTT